MAAVVASSAAGAAVPVTAASSRTDLPPCTAGCGGSSSPAPPTSSSPPSSPSPALFWNLRHCRTLGVPDLSGLPPTVERLWLGPSFDPLLTFADLAHGLPESLVELDLDLTVLLRLRSEEPIIDDRRERNHDSNDDTDEDATTTAREEEDCLVRTAQEGLQILFRRLTHLKSLCLRLPDQHADVLVARAVAECLPDTTNGSSTSYSSCLTSLDLRQGPVGAAGVAALGSALRRQQRATAATTTSTWGDPLPLLRELTLDCRSSGRSNRSSVTTTTTTMATAPETARALASLLSSGGCGATLRRLDVGCSAGGGGAGGGNDDDVDDGWTDAALAPMCEALRDNRTLTDLGLFGCDVRRVTALTGLRLRDALRDHNATLERLTWHGVSSVPSSLLLEVDWYLRLNRAGRRYLRYEDPPWSVVEETQRGDSESMSSAVSSPPSALPLALWPRLLGRIAQPKSPPSVLFYFVRHKVDLLLRRP